MVCFDVELKLPGMDYIKEQEAGNLSIKTSCTRFPWFYLIFFPHGFSHMLFYHVKFQNFISKKWKGLSARQWWFSRYWDWYKSKIILIIYLKRRMSNVAKKKQQQKTGRWNSLHYKLRAFLWVPIKFVQNHSLVKDT